MTLADTDLGADRALERVLRLGFSISYAINASFLAARVMANSL